nr:MAG TPA: hypothetical protein [Caudoviricetes sp.]
MFPLKLPSCCEAVRLFPIDRLNLRCYTKDVAFYFATSEKDVLFFTQRAGFVQFPGSFSYKTKEQVLMNLFFCV